MTVFNYPGGWPPEGRPFSIGSIDLGVVETEHPFHATEHAAAVQNWQQEIAANPALFDGRMVFFDAVGLDDGTLRGKGHLVPFSTFMWWRKQGPEVRGIHIFAWAVPISSDGAIIAIRMGAHTANAGQVYCAAGSLDASDIVDGRCDIAGNMRREVLEETGLDLSDAQPDSGFHVVHRDRRVTVFRFFHFGDTADALLARIAAHMLVDEEKEIAEAVAIRSADPHLHPYNEMMGPILNQFFNPPGAGELAVAER